MKEVAFLFAPLGSSRVCEVGLGFTSSKAMAKKCFPKLSRSSPRAFLLFRSQEVHLIMMQLLSLSSGASHQLKSFLVDTQFSSKGGRFSLPEKRASLGSFGISNGKLIVTLLCTTEKKRGEWGMSSCGQN